MKQEVRVHADFVVEFDAKHSTDALRKMVDNYLRRAFHNNNLIKYTFVVKEEAEIYGNK